MIVFIVVLPIFTSVTLLTRGSEKDSIARDRTILEVPGGAVLMHVTSAV
jgi:hypothetical protein